MSINPYSKSTSRLHGQQGYAVRLSRIAEAQISLRLSSCRYCTRIIYLF